MTKREKLEKVTIYSESVNYLGEVEDSTEIATFRNFNWASAFVDYLGEQLKQYEGDTFRYRVSLGNCRSAIVTKGSTAETVKNALTRDYFNA